MGIQNRDYYRNEASSGGWAGLSGRSMWQTILIITVAVYLLQMVITVPRQVTLQDVLRVDPQAGRTLQKMVANGETEEVEQILAQYGGGHHDSLLEQWGRLDPIKVSEGQIWRLVTYAFLHDRDAPTHILFNMLVLWMFGSAIEQLLGRREFLAFYLVSAIASGLAHVLFAYTMREFNTAVGASGSLMAVSMLFAIYYPTAPINVFFFLVIEARWLIIIYAIYDLHPVLLALSGVPHRDRVAHAAHLGGLAFGLLYYKLHWRLTDWFPTRGGQSIGQRLTKWWTRPRLRVYRTPVDGPAPVQRPPVRTASPRDMERRVDEILKKIKDHGEASLTDEERALLRDASQAYKKRNT